MDTQFEVYVSTQDNTISVRANRWFDANDARKLAAELLQAADDSDANKSAFK